MAESDEPIYLYFKTEFQHKVNLWTASWTESEWNDCESTWSAENPDGTFNWRAADQQANAQSRFTGLGEYFEGDNYTILRLGEYEPGTKITVRMTVANDYTIVKNFLFYTFHPDLFQQDD